MSTRALAKKRTEPSIGGPLRPGAEGGKRDLNRKRRRESLLETSLPLFLARGIDGVTIDDIVAAAGIAKGSYYRYFDDKAGLVRCLLAPVATQVEASFAACESSLAVAASVPALGAAYQSLALALAGIVAESPGVIRLYLQEARAPAAAARTPVAEIARSIADGAIRLTHVAHARGLFRPMDARVSAAAVVGAAERLLFGALSGEDLGAPEAIISSLIALVLDGLRRPV